MSKEQKKILIFVGILLAIIALLAIILGILNKNKKEENQPSVPEQPEEISKEIVRLEDESYFFGVQQAINEYYELIMEDDSQMVYQMLDKSYISEQGITSSNVLTKINNKYEFPDYYVSEIYYNVDSVVTYFFVQGYVLDWKNDNPSISKNVNFLVILKGNHYVLQPISTTSIEDYAKNYDIEKIEIDNSTRFSRASVSEEKKLVTYLSEFINLLRYDPEVAYGKLSDTTKEKYSSYQDFRDESVSLSETLSPIVFGYQVNLESNQKVYHIIDNNQNKIVLTENHLMDYKISYE